LIESFTDDSGTTTHEHVVRRDDDLWAHLVNDCVAFIKKIASLVNSDRWNEWEHGDVDVRKQIFGNFL
jgi:hypothetical protein